MKTPLLNSCFWAFLIALSGPLSAAFGAETTPVALPSIVHHNTLESPVSLEAAYREGGKSGKLVIVLSSTEERNHPELASGNRVFYGNEQDLWQLDASVPSMLGAVETGLTFFRGIEKGAEQTGELTFSPVLARIACSTATRAPQNELARVNETEQAELERKLASGSTHLHPLPGLLEPLYLFTPTTSTSRERSPSAVRTSHADLVLVQGPVFNFYGDYTIEIGGRDRRGHVKFSEVPVVADYREWRSQRPGEIRFASGGGLYIPLTIDLLPKADRDHRGAPTLIRAGGSELELLQIPHLSRAEIEAFGFGKAEFARLHTPCDASLDGAVAQVAPRITAR